MFFGSFLGFDLLLNVPDFARQPSKRSVAGSVWGFLSIQAWVSQQNVPPHLPSQPSIPAAFPNQQLPMDRSRMVRDDSDM